MYMINMSKMFRGTFNGPGSILKMRIWFLFLSFKSLRIHMKWPRWRFSLKNSSLEKTFKNSWLSRWRSFIYIHLWSTSLWSVWRIINNAILLSISRKNTSSTLEIKESSLNTKYGTNIFRAKEDNCTILYIKFVNIRISKWVIFRIFM